LGLEVEGVTDPGAKLGSFTLAKVLEAEQHPMPTGCGSAR
jgi:phenylalanyl-tRNA synthetase beta chain